MCPPAVCKLGDTVAQAADIMVEHRCGAVLVMSKDEIRGIFSERDVLNRVVAQRRDPEKTLVSEVMTYPVQTVRDDAGFESALRIMMRRHYRHLPVIDAQGRPIGMLSIRRIMGYHADNLKQAIASLAQYIGVEGHPGG